MSAHASSQRMMDPPARWVLLVLLCLALYGCGGGSITKTPFNVSTGTSAGFASVTPTLTVTNASVKTATPDPTKTAGAPDKDILFNSTCVLPCWGRIIPGETNRDAFVDLIKQNPNVAHASLEEYRVGSGTIIGWNYLDEPNKGGGVFIRDNKIKVIDLDATSGITLGEVIKTFGEPSKIQTDTGFFGQEQSGYDARIYYPQQGMVIHFARTGFSSPPNFRASVQPNLVVDEISLFPAGSVEDFVSIAEKFKGPTTIAKIYLLPLQDWRGYGDYEIPPPLTP